MWVVSASLKAAGSVVGWLAMSSRVVRFNAAPSTAATGPVTPSFGAANAPAQKNTSVVDGLPNGSTPPSKTNWSPLTWPVNTRLFALTVNDFDSYTDHTSST